MDRANTGLDKLTNYFLLNTSLLIFFGVVMVYSSSYMYAKEQMGSSVFFLIKQLAFIAAGVGAAVVMAKTKMSFWYKHAYLLNAVCVALLCLTFIPGLGVTMKGSHRWLNVGVTTIQPGEFVKYSLMFASIRYFENFMHYSVRDRAIYGVGIIMPLLLFVLQPDFGTFFIAGVVVAFIAFMSHFPRRYFWSGAFVGAIMGVAILIAAPYRVKRLLVFLDPWKDPRNSGFQIIQSFLAFANGSWFGQGLGNSNEKLFYLPEAYNDFIFSVVGEELGFVGVLFTVLLFLGFIWLGFKLALSVRSRMGAILASSVIFCIGFQAFLNMGVVLGVLPTKGLNLPFISYGGSSMVANLGALGLVFAAIKMTGKEIKENTLPTKPASSGKALRKMARA